MKNRIKVIAAAVSLLPAFVFSDEPATGWKQTAAGTYSYNDPQNWVDGEINGIFGDELVLEGDQNITFSEDTVLNDGLKINCSLSEKKITFASDTTDKRTITVSGNIDSTSLGEVILDKTLQLDLGGAIRTITSENTMRLNAVISSGGLVFKNKGVVVLSGENTYSAGTWLMGPGRVRVNNNYVFGKDGTELHICEGAVLDCGRKNSTYKLSSHKLFFNGDFTIGITTKDLGNIDFQKSIIYVMRPVTITALRYQFLFGGQLAEDSKYDMSDITFVGDSAYPPKLYFSSELMSASKCTFKDISLMLYAEDYKSCDGTFFVEGGSISLSDSYSLSNATIVAKKSTVNISSSSAGTHKIAQKLIMKSGKLSISGVEMASVRYEIGGELVFEPANGTVLIDIKKPTEGTVELVANEISAKNVFVAVSTDTLAHLGGDLRIISRQNVETIGESQNSEGVVPWMRGADGSIMTYNLEVGFKQLSSPKIYSESYEDFKFASEGENAVFSGVITNVFTSEQMANSLDIKGTGTAVDNQPVVLSSDDAAKLTLSSGALNLYSKCESAAARFEVPVDFGDNTGYISIYAAYKRLDFTGAIHGNKGLVVGHLGQDITQNKDNKGLLLKNFASDYEGDVYIYGGVQPCGKGVFPYGDRKGNLYLYGYLTFPKAACEVRINGLFGSGGILHLGSNRGDLYIGADGADGNFEGFFETGTGSNFGIYKIGKGKQRFANTLATKYDLCINEGTLQIDGAIALDPRYSIIVSAGATFEGSFESKANINLNSGSVLAPGSAEKPNVPSYISNGKSLEIADGAKLRFYVSADRASQLILQEGCQITGTAVTVPVNVDCNIDKAGQWLLLEADSFSGKNFEMQNRIQGSSLEVRQILEDDVIVREQLWLVKRKGFSIIVR